MHNLKPAARVPRPRPAPELKSRRPRQLRHAEIAASTGPLSALQGRKRILVVADVENIAYGGRDLGLNVDFGKLADCLRSGLATPALHAVFSAPPRDDRIHKLLSAFGWTPHHREIVGRHTNADVAVGFHAAALIARTKPDTCVIATGDGELALDVAQGVRAAFARCALIATLSLAGSTSRLIDARCTRHIDINLEIGRDVMQAVVACDDAIPAAPTALAN
jgi:hypothetical protein